MRMSTKDKLLQLMVNNHHLSVLTAQRLTGRTSADRRLRDIAEMFPCRKYWENGPDSRYMVYALTAKGKEIARKYLGVKNVG